MLVVMLSASRAAAQDTTSIAQSDSVLCEGRRITSIELGSGIRAVADEVPGLLRPIVRTVLGGARTKTSALRPYVLLKEGSTCTESRRREGERLLRGLKYVAGARLRPETDGDGVRIVVETSDDLRPIVGLTLDGSTPESMKLGTVNFAGTGTLVEGEWADGGAFRDGLGFRASNPTMFGRRATLGISIDRRPLGDQTFISFSEPYLTRFQSIAWELSLRDVTEFIPLDRNVADRSAWRTNWRTFNAGALGRVALGSIQLLAGGLYTHERIAPADSGVIITSSGLDSPTSPA
jgi:hypothetical protein